MKKMQSLSLINGGTKLVEKEADIEEVDGQNYGLRENPKKTMRVVDDQNFPLPQEKVCKQCGKIFQSMKALCGHMAFHSNRKLVMDNDFDTEFEGKKRRSKSKLKRYNNNKSTNDSSFVSEIEEKDQEEIAICLMMLSRDCGSCRGGANSVVESSDNYAVVLEAKSRSNEVINAKKEGLECVYDGDEVLDMDEKGDEKLNHSSSLDAEMVQQEDSDSEYFLDVVAMSESEKIVKIRSHTTELMKKSTAEYRTDNGRIAIRTWRNESKKRTKEFIDDDELVVESYKRIKYGSAYAEVLDTQQHKRSKYECFNCKRSFKSFQALGGHRPCHKRNNADDATDQETILKAECVGNKKGISKEVTNKAVKKVRPKKQKGYVCPFCPRVFKSGQALGGHKRTHFLSSNAEITNQFQGTKPEVHDLFDLNLPAPQEDGNNAQFALW